MKWLAGPKWVPVGQVPVGQVGVRRGGKTRGGLLEVLRRGCGPKGCPWDESAGASAAGEGEHGGAEVAAGRRVPVGRAGVRIASYAHASS